MAAIHTHDSPQKPFIISKMVFNTLSPLKQLAAKRNEIKKLDKIKNAKDFEHLRSVTATKNTNIMGNPIVKRFGIEKWYAPAGT